MTFVAGNLLVRKSTMSMDYFSISMATDIAKPSTSSLLPLNTPENKRELPCKTCSHTNECEAQLLECVAIRRWYASGDYLDKDIARLLRKMKTGR